MASNDSDNIAVPASSDNKAPFDDAATYGTYNDEAVWDDISTPDDPHSIGYGRLDWLYKPVVKEGVKVTEERASHQWQDSAQVNDATLRSKSSAFAATDIASSASAPQEGSPTHTQVAKSIRRKRSASPPKDQKRTRTERHIGLAQSYVSPHGEECETELNSKMASVTAKHEARVTELQNEIDSLKSEIEKLKNNIEDLQG
ncbi:hypothetical protein E8E11_002766 [Didymella keratinophila]|nr:hypothetical protein E8E11_002766 [Didymella keratinophila]